MRTEKLSRYAAYAWGVLAYNLAVVLWGAFVRATGSGAGCGSHWPLCNGEVIPRDAHTAMLIELTHRVTSGIALLLVVGMLVWALRAYPKGHVVRSGAILSMALMVLEALLGAGLVLFELVAHNASWARAVAMSAHLINTFLLLGAITLTAWWASGGARVRLRGQGAAGAVLGLGALALLLLGASGAVTALGDTLYAGGRVSEGVSAEGAELVQLLTVLFLLQLAVGWINVRLAAPVPLQLVHLLLADFVWLAFVLLGAAALADRTVGQGSQSATVRKAESAKV
ncbi:MAG TPA: COX15/CtaA family protein [Longimicrobiaceae bacterium]|nr:COX15/CtaA family protein [Longimicrobiaceae bacterium]